MPCLSLLLFLQKKKKKKKKKKPSNCTMHHAPASFKGYLIIPCLSLLLCLLNAGHIMLKNPTLFNPHPFSLSFVSCSADESTDGCELPHIRQLEVHPDSDDLLSIDSHDSDETSPSEKSRPPVLISNGLPPIPSRLMKRVEDGLFVEMAELLPSHLDSADLNVNEGQVTSCKQLPTVTDIIDWIQCFAVYMAIISRHKPKRIADLLGYQSLIIGASMDCREGKWVIYDRRFRLKASASRNALWSVIDVTLWNMTFPERAIQSRQQAGSTPYASNPSQRSQRQYQYQPICLDWNENPNGCSRSPCRFKHIC